MANSNGPSFLTTNIDNPLNFIIKSRAALERLYPLTRGQPTIFVNSQGGDTYNAKLQRSMWKEVLTRLGIRYRDMYNMRHTYATFGLMYGVNPAFMAGQLGHSVEEFFKTYAKWINSDLNSLQMHIIELALANHKQATKPS